MVAVDDVVVYRFNRFREYDNMGEVALTIGYAQATTLEKDEMRRELADMNVAALQVSSKSRIASRRSHHVGTALHTNNHAWCNHTSVCWYQVRESCQHVPQRMATALWHRQGIHQNDTCSESVGPYVLAGGKSIVATQ